MRKISCISIVLLIVSFFSLQEVFAAAPVPESPFTVINKDIKTANSAYLAQLAVIDVKVADLASTSKKLNSKDYIQAYKKGARIPTRFIPHINAVGKASDELSEAIVELLQLHTVLHKAILARCTILTMPNEQLACFQQIIDLSGATIAFVQPDLVKISIASHVKDGWRFL